MVSTVKILNLINPTNLKCGQKSGLPGKFDEFNCMSGTASVQLNLYQIFYPSMHRYTKFGGPVPRRPAEDMAFAVARFIQNNGSFFNYYMVS